ncbi:hypothetical protein U3B84_004382 [Citrobacter freundii]|uniref:hypothetical protein n=1 Tax=Citrobacter freundii TaxID=546 RepID=UPI00076493E6|nr:hypothetical protein [Citrobacter freundii]AYL74928.1 hypothetical protein CUC52_05200 [Citrobacter freundii]EGT3576535.1 hypothetical protein [Citrobacter freundii]EMA4455880.1 hypothetical protein [Citrobacter freundii]KWZ93264.1 hypothetical protein HMPREF3212_00346 [Citrobacter freundii]MCR3713934.1 hypothetical protein [Citrobacter freundii]
MASFFPTWVTDVATIATLIGFFMTLWVVRTTNQLKDKFKGRVRIPEISSDLNTSASRIADLLRNREGQDNWDSIRDDISKEIGDCIPLIENLIDKVNSGDKSSVIRLMDEFAPKSGFLRRRKRRAVNDQDLAWDLYTELTSFIKRLEQIQKDMRFEV